MQLGKLHKLIFLEWLGTLVMSCETDLLISTSEGFKTSHNSRRPNKITT